MQEAILYQKFPSGDVQCHLCNHFCKIELDRAGKCGVRKNIGGILYALSYGKVIAEHLDPIEKKPLYRFLPGTVTYSLACPGCNFSCLNCQNHDISQIDDYLSKINAGLPETKPEEIIERALQASCPSISYTYTEPTIYAEFALDCMRLAKEKELKNVWVSNGFMTGDLLASVAPLLDAANIDLKFFTEKHYQEICGARLQPILDNLVRLKNYGVHLEITTLIIPTLNNNKTELSNIAKFIYQELGSDTPWHLSAFYPTYRLAELYPTKNEDISQAQEIGLGAGLKYVYAGNI